MLRESSEKSSKKKSSKKSKKKKSEKPEKNKVIDEDEDLRIALELQNQWNKEENGNFGSKQEEEDAKLARQLAENFSNSENFLSDADLARQLQDEWEFDSGPKSGQFHIPDVGSFNIEDLLASGGISKDNLDSLLGQVKQSIIPIITEELKTLHLPATDESITVPKLGDIDFSLDDIKLRSIVIPPDDLHLTFENNIIRLIVNNIEAQLDTFDWSFEQCSFPKLKDAGRATAGITGCTIDVILQIQMKINGVALNVSQSDVKIGKLDIKISGTNKNFLYNILIAVVVKMLKSKLEKELSDLIEDAINTHGKQLLGGVSL